MFQSKKKIFTNVCYHPSNKGSAICSRNRKKQRLHRFDQLIECNEFGSKNCDIFSGAKSILEDVLNVSQDDAEREKIKYPVTGMLNISKRQASKQFGIARLSERAKKFHAASENVRDIQTKNNHCMILEQKAYLSRIGADDREPFNVDEADSISSDSDTHENDDYESEDDLEVTERSNNSRM